MTADSTYTPPKAKYISFIDGLRAVSIISVVGYHIGIPQVQGGFIGVDVFFVISGYLIITQIAQGLSNDTFSLKEFWGKRILRILPTYLMVILASIFAAQYILVFPENIKAFQEQVAWSAVMMANHYFLLQQGYFDAASETKPLLHLWSLAVEEQFYLVAPLLMTLAWLEIIRKKLRSFSRQIIAVGVLIAVSFVSCIALTGANSESNYAFFLMPLRAWEFMAGGAITLALPKLQSLSPRVASTAGGAGLVLILLSASLLSGDLNYPSYWAAFPVLGAVMVIAFGLANPEGIAPRVLAIRPLVGIGLVSYAWYLWHWPLLTFTRIYFFDEPNLWRDFLSSGIVGLVMAIGTYFILERPIAHWRRSRSQPWRWRLIGAGLASCSFVVLAGSVPALRELPTIEAPRVRGNAGECEIRSGVAPINCQSVVGDSKFGVLMGDSHAGALFAAFRDRFAENDIVLGKAHIGACPPLLGVELRRMNQHRFEECISLKDQLVSSIEEGIIAPDFVILSGYWWSYTNGSSREIVPLDHQSAGPELRGLAYLEEALSDTIETFNRLGVREIIIVAPMPTFPRSVPECLARSDAYGIDRDEKCSIPHTQAAEYREAFSVISDVANQNENVSLVDPWPLFCSSELCIGYSENTALFVDNNHISDAGARIIFESELSIFLPALKR